jgi:ParB family chromosome partitioning protein
MAVSEIDDMLNSSSGMLGLTGFADMRDVEDAITRGDERARPGERAVLARRVIEEGLSVRGTERLVLARKAGAPAPTGPAKKVPAVEAAAVASIERKLVSRLGARVSLRHSPKRGRIVIEYAGNDDLHRILEKLGVEA